MGGEGEQGEEERACVCGTMTLPGHNPVDTLSVFWHPLDFRLGRYPSSVLALSRSEIEPNLTNPGEGGGLRHHRSGALYTGTCLLCPTERGENFTAVYTAHCISLLGDLRNLSYFLIKRK